MNKLIILFLSLLFSCSHTKTIVKEPGISNNTSYDYYVRKKRNISKDFYVIKTTYFKDGKKIKIFTRKYFPYLASNFIVSEKIILKDSTGKIIYKCFDATNTLYKDALIQKHNHKQSR